MYVLLLAAAGLVSLAVIAALIVTRGSSALPAHRRRPGRNRDAKSAALALVSSWVMDMMGRLVKGREVSLAEQLNQASLHMRPAEFMVWNLIASVVMSAIGALAGGMPGVVVGGLLAVTAIQGLVLFRASRRRVKFDSQMLETLQIISGALRAGQSLHEAVLMVAAEADEPTSVEFTRAVNEARIGSDMVGALRAVADRMDSESMSWMVDTIAINQEVGGSLADAIDGATETIRARMELDGQVKTLSAEGKMSAYVLLALPFFVAGATSVFTPGFMNPLFEHWVGWVVLAFCAAQYIVGGLIIRKMIKIKY